VTPPRDVRDLVGDDVPGDELERLARVHNLILQAGPPPELPPSLARPPAEREGALIPFLARRRSTLVGLVAAAVLAAFAIGYVVGGRTTDFEAVAEAPPMVGVGPERDARATIALGAVDDVGNWTLELQVSGLAELPPQDYYSLYLSRKGEPIARCGTFRVGDGTTTVQMVVGYDRTRFDGWALAREKPRGEHPGPVVMVTRSQPA
jgi:hypothetical protein